MNEGPSISSQGDAGNGTAFSFEKERASNGLDETVMLQI
jgi:hypothetical protein